MRRADCARSRAPHLAMLVLAASASAADAASRTFPVGESPFSVAKGDFNRDGIRDLVTANIGPFFEPPNDDVSVLIGKPDGTFRREMRYPAGDGPTSVVVSDFNRDGRQDLVTTNAFSPRPTTDSTARHYRSSRGDRVGRVRRRACRCYSHRHLKVRRAAVEAPTGLQLSARSDLGGLGRGGSQNRLSVTPTAWPCPHWRRPRLTARVEFRDPRKGIGEIEEAFRARVRGNAPR